jgi:hypothetical protein
MTTPMCTKLGVTLLPGAEDQMAAAIKNEAVASGLEGGVADALIDAAGARQSVILQTDLKAASEAAKSAAQLRGLRLIFVRYGELCVAAAADSLFSRFLKAPSAFDVEAQATLTADTMLEDGGLASWQTPSIQARGDIMMLAGACRSRLGPVRSDELVRLYGRSDDVRERSYYTRAFDLGLADTELQELDRVQCERAVGRNKAKVAARR